MRLDDLKKLLDCKELTRPLRDDDFEIKYAFSGDLMSDALMILRTAPEDFCEHGVLITGNSTMQAIRTAEMLDFSVILMTRGKEPTEAVIEQANESKIIIISTKDVSYTSSGKMYKAGILGISDL